MGDDFFSTIKTKNGGAVPLVGGSAPDWFRPRIPFPKLCPPETPTTVVDEFHYVVRYRKPIFMTNAVPPGANMVGLAMPANRARVAARVSVVPGAFTDGPSVLFLTEQPGLSVLTVPTFYGVLISEVANRDYVWAFPTAPQNAIYYQWNDGGGTRNATLCVEETWRVKPGEFLGTADAAVNTGPLQPTGVPAT
jgi:hypothetical protein